MTTPVSPARAGPAAPASVPAADRRYELDWLRAFVVLGLIPFHAAVIFSTTSDVYLKNTQTNDAITVLGAFAGTWGMPLLFSVAGASAYFALNHRKASRYLLERVQRLLVPFIFASLTIIPIQVYVVLISNPALAKNFNIPINVASITASPLTFYGEYLRAYGYFLTHFTPYLAIVFWGHLWFIPRLFAYALVTLPVIFWLKSARGKRLLTALGQLMRYPGVIFLFALPLSIIDMFVRGVGLNALTEGWPLYDDWVQFFFFLVYFLYGYLAFAISTMPAAIMRHGWAALGLGLAGVALALWMAQGGLGSDPLGGVEGFIADALVRGFVSWFWVVAILSFAFHRLSFTNGLLRYLNEAAFPIYVLHMPIVTLVGLFVIGLNIPWELKYVLIIVIALPLTVGLYELLVRRFRVMRALFGLKPQPRQALDATPETRWWNRRAPRAPRLSGGDRYAQ